MLREVEEFEKIIYQDCAGGKIFNDYFGVVLPFQDSLIIGETVEVFMKSVFLGKAQIISMRTFKAHEVRPVLSALETGDENVKHFFRKISSNYGVEVKPFNLMAHVVIRYNERNYEAMNELITGWYKGLQNAES